jgi:hypothetical protein
VQAVPDLDPPLFGSVVLVLSALLLLGFGSEVSAAAASAFGSGRSSSRRATRCGGRFWPLASCWLSPPSTTSLRTSSSASSGSAPGDRRVCLPAPVLAFRQQLRLPGRSRGLRPQAQKALIPRLPLDLSSSARAGVSFSSASLYCYQRQGWHRLRGCSSPFLGIWDEDLDRLQPLLLGELQVFLSPPEVGRCRPILFVRVLVRGVGSTMRQILAGDRSPRHERYNPFEN